MKNWLAAQRLAVVGFVLVICTPLSAQLEEHERVWAETQYYEGAAVPRNATEAEKLFMAQFPRWLKRGVSAPPTGPIFTPGEYGPMEGILLAYEGQTSWLTILDQMAAQITTVGDADVFVMADNGTEVTSIMTRMGNAGANLARVHAIVVQTDTIWIRDYGPRYVYEGGVRVIVDHVYNRPRPFDDNLPVAFAAYKNHARYDLPLVHGGGNYHLDETGASHTTRLINNENPSLTEQEIHDLWQAYQNLDTNFYQPFPISVDSTQHIDMWMEAISDDEVIISDWPFNVGSTQDQICDAAATTLTNAGYTVHRVPARSVGGTHYTYTNVVMCNDLVLLPSYTNATVSVHNSEALAIWQNALPGKTIVQINCEAIVTAAGVMHCIVMHLPQSLGGVDPVVYLKTRPNGDVLLPGQQFEIRWISDDDQGVANIDLWLSTDGGNMFDVPIAMTTPDDGSFLWTLPDINTTQARLRAVARDADGNLGSNDTEFNFTIMGTSPCPSDCDPPNPDTTYGNGVVDMNDFFAVVAHWRDGPGVYDLTPDLGDGTFGDGIVNLLDMVAVLSALGPCP